MKGYPQPSDFRNDCIHISQGLNRIQIYKYRKPDTENHRLINITDRTLDVVFSRFRGFSFTKTLRQKPKGITRMLQRESLFYAACEKTLHLEKMTSSVLSAIVN